MKILLSAYACEPNIGSEPGVGWHWALEIARLGHEVWVLTRANNRAPIETELAQSPPIKNLHFIYYDLPLWARCWKKGNRGIHLYYFLWQWGAYHYARQVHRKKHFEYVHHITFGGVRQPSFMGRLGIPFIFGPVGGGETAPWRLRVGYGLRGWIWDALRDIANWVIRFDPLMHATFRQAQWIYVKTPQSGLVVPNVYKEKVRCQLEIGIDNQGRSELLKGKTESEEPFRILFAGRFIYWKGMHLGLPAFERLVSVVPDARLTMVGKGPEERRWHRLAERLNISQSIDWVSWMPQEELTQLYHSHDVFLFPSLHDSSGNVVLEALASCLPVICLDLGGPGQIVNETCGFKVETDGLNEERTTLALADCMVELAQDSALRIRLSEGTAERIKEFGWSSLVARLFSELS